MTRAYKEIFLDLLDSIRGRSEATRWALVLSLTAISTAGLLVLFAWDVNQNLAKTSAVKDQDRGTFAALLSPFQSLGRSIAAIRQGEDPQTVAERTAKELEQSRAQASQAVDPSSQRMMTDVILDGIRDFFTGIGSWISSLGHPRDLLEKRIQSN